MKKVLLTVSFLLVLIMFSACDKNSQISTNDLTEVKTKETIIETTETTEVTTSAPEVLFTTSIDGEKFVGEHAWNENKTSFSLIDKNGNAIYYITKKTIEDNNNKSADFRCYNADQVDGICYEDGTSVLYAPYFGFRFFDSNGTVIVSSDDNDSSTEYKFLIYQNKTIYALKKLLMQTAMFRRMQTVILSPKMVVRSPAMQVSSRKLLHFSKFFSGHYQQLR